jgi:hypothetical protein
VARAVEPWRGQAPRGDSPLADDMRMAIHVAQAQVPVADERQSFEATVDMSVSFHTDARLILTYCMVAYVEQGRWLRLLEPYARSMC